MLFDINTSAFFSSVSFMGRLGIIKLIVHIVFEDVDVAAQKKMYRFWLYMVP